MKPLAAVVLATLLALTASAGDLRRTIDMAEFGPVRLVGPAGAAAGFAIAFSDAGGVAESDRAAMQTLGDVGLAVAMVEEHGAAARRGEREQAASDEGADRSSHGVTSRGLPAQEIADHGGRHALVGDQAVLDGVADVDEAGRAHAGRV